MTIKKSRRGYRWVDYTKTEKNFKCFCNRLKKTVKNDSMVCGLFGSLLVCVWADTNLVYIIY